MPDQETYGRFTQGAWNLIKSIRLSEVERESLRLMIESKPDTITYEEAQAMLYDVVHGISQS